MQVNDGPDRRAGEIAESTLSTGEIIIIVVFAAAGAMVQGCVGIGFGLVAGPALIALDPGFAPGPLLFAGQLVGLRHIFAERHEIDRAALRRCLFGLPVGMGAGLLMLTMVSDRVLAIFIGAFTAAAALALLLGASVNRSPRVEVGAGVGTSFASVTAGLPGPPLVVAFSDMKPPAMRGTSSAFILTVAVVAAVSLVVAGEYRGEELALTLWLVPGVLIGMLAARWLRPVVDTSWFRPAVLVVALIGALALIARQI